MSADTTPGKGGEEVTRITAKKNEADLGKMGLPPELAALSPGAAWLLEHGGTISGHIEEGTGDLIIDEHIPDKFATPAEPKPEVKP